jgi:arginase family enzyme
MLFSIKVVFLNVLQHLNPKIMQIIQGDSAFSFVSVDLKDMSNIFDAFQTNRLYLMKLINDDDEAKAAKELNIKISKLREVRKPEMKKIIQEKIEWYKNQQVKMMKYVKK